MLEAVESFVVGFSCGRSFTHPFLATRHDSIIVLHDAPRAHGKSRLSEIVACDIDPEVVVELAHRHSTGKYAISSFYSSGTELHAVESKFRRWGYRLIVREPLMVLNVAGFCVGTIAHDVRRVRTPAEAEAVKAADGHRQILPEHLEKDDSTLRLYAAWDKEAVVGWVRSIRAAQGDNWVSNLFVAKERRREGIGTALISEMLIEDFRYGVKRSVLLASKTGTLLYNRLGYEQIGTALVFLPTKYPLS